MNIILAAPINPYEFRDYITDNKNIPNYEGGIAINIIVKGFLEQGHHVYVFSSHKQKEQELEFKGDNLYINIVKIPDTTPLHKFFSRYLVVKRLTTSIQKFVNLADVIHAHWTYEYTMAILKFKKKPLICTVRDWYPKIYKLQKLLSIDKLVWFTLRFMFYKTMKTNKLWYIAPSEYIQKSIQEKYYKKNVAIIYNPIANTFINKQIQPFSNNKVLISICNNVFNPSKNIETLLLAFKKYHKEQQNAKLILVGDYDTENPKFKKWDNNKLLESVYFCGYVNHNMLPELLDKASVLIHPSLEESFGNTLLEGMARGLIVIAGNNSGATKTVVGDGKFGLLCDVTDINSIYQAIKKTDNTSLANELIKKATLYLKENYSEERIVTKHIELYKKCLDSSRNY